MIKLHIINEIISFDLYFNRTLEGMFIFVKRAIQIKQYLYILIGFFNFKNSISSFILCKYRPTTTKKLFESLYLTSYIFMKLF